MLGLMKYNFKVYIKNNRFIIPIMFFCIFQSIYYSAENIKYEPAVTFCSNVSFCVMIWTGFTYCLYQDSRTEEVIFLKVQNERVYWISKVLFMMSIAFLTALLGTSWAFIRSVGNLTLLQGVYGFLIQFITAVLGLLVGMLLQVKVTGDKNKSILYMIFVGLIAMIKLPIIRECFFLKYVLWILPPVSDLAFCCIKQDYFSMDLLLFPVLYCIIYIAIQIFVYYKVMKKKLF